MRKNNDMERLTGCLKPLVKEGLCVAFSGGVDSTVILKAALLAAEEVGGAVHAVTFQTRLHPTADVEETEALAWEMGARFSAIYVDEFQDERILENPIDRCYLCKKLLFSSLQKYAGEHRLKYIADGTNEDDRAQYRPGRKALKELGVISPLMDLGFGKETVRRLAREWELQVYNKPSMPCLATRLPYGQRFDFELLQLIHQGEEMIRKLGFYDVRLRLHSDILRIEVGLEELPGLLQYREELTAGLKELGFMYITLDLEGFRSGSMDIGISEEDKKRVQGD